jgi:hypothetical protein
MVPGWLYQARRTLSAKAQLVSTVETPLMPEGQTVNFSALAVPAPTREPRATAAPRPAATRAFFIVRDFFSFALFAECSVGPSVSSIPSTSTANLANYFLHNWELSSVVSGAGLFATHYACGSQLQRDWMSLAYGPAAAIAAWTTTPRPPPDTP